VWLQLTDSALIARIVGEFGLTLLQQSNPARGSWFARYRPAPISGLPSIGLISVSTPACYPILQLFCTHKSVPFATHFIKRQRKLPHFSYQPGARRDGCLSFYT